MSNGNGIKLTSRELEVLKMVCSGLSDKQVAAELGISKGTSGKHRQNIMDKIRARGVVKLTHWALQHQIVTNLYA